jgi:hypothetical protein
MAGAQERRASRRTDFIGCQLALLRIVRSSGPPNFPQTPLVAFLNADEPVPRLQHRYFDG